MKAYAHATRRDACGWKTKKLSTKHDVFSLRGYMRPASLEERDPTEGNHSRPSAKRTIRNAERAQKKSARQSLKRSLNHECRYE